MLKTLPKVIRRVYNDLPEYQVCAAGELEKDNPSIFQCGLVDGCAVFMLAGPGSVLIDIAARSGDYYRVEVYGGKNSWTRNELNLKAIELYNEIQMFLIASHSWVFSFAE